MPGSAPKARCLAPFAPFSGFSLIEAILALAILGAIALLTAPYFTGSLQRTDVDRFAAEAADALSEAQAASMSGKQTTLGAAAQYGVRFESNSFCLFEGGAPVDCNAATVLAKHALTGFVTATVTAGISNVTFTDRRGRPNALTTVDFCAPGQLRKTLQINAEGMIDVTTGTAC